VSCCLTITLFQTFCSSGKFMYSQYSQICPKGHLSLMAICLMRPVCFCLSAAHSLLKHCVLNDHLSYNGH
jgi:hypothetical protein